MHMSTNTGQSSPGNSGDAADPNVGAAPLHSGPTTGEGHSPDLCTAGQHQGGQTTVTTVTPDVYIQFI